MTNQTKFKPATETATSCYPLINGHVHAAYLAKGFLKSGPLSLNEVDAFGGEIGAIFIAVKPVETVCLALHKAESLGFEYPGVFDYEVTEPLGEWLRKNPTATHTLISVELIKMMEDLFSRDCSEISAYLAQMNVLLSSTER